MKDTLINWFTRFNSFLIRISGGKIGSKLGTQTVLLLHTVGRKSGRERVTPIAYFDYEDKYVLVASNWGRNKQADWFLNLQRNPRARVEVRGTSQEVQARVTEDKEYERLWNFVTKRHPPYLDYQKMTARRIPIVLLEPIANFS
jgi:deazaflavin-dependent oxidoreductase (nitroreductase family)